jgi:hypothetical protein
LEKYAAEGEAIKKGTLQLKQALKEAFGSKRADFNYTTKGILKSYFCCRIVMSQDYLRSKPALRNDFYFNRGLSALNKESDMGYIIH